MDEDDDGPMMAVLSMSVATLPPPEFADTTPPAVAGLIMDLASGAKMARSG